MSFKHVLRRVGGALAATGAIAAGAIAVATPASAVNWSNTALIPTVAPKVDVAIGPAFELVQRDSSGLSLAERWEFIPTGSGHYYIRNLHDSRYMDAQRTTESPQANSPVGSNPFDGGLSQQWTLSLNSDGSARLINRQTGYVLTWNGSGANPGYVQKPVSSPSVFATFTFKTY